MQRDGAIIYRGALTRLLALVAAVVVAAAIGTTAAGSPRSAARFAVTLDAEVHTTLRYLRAVRRDETCQYTHWNRSVRVSEVTSTRPTIIRVRAGRRSSYAPSALHSLRLRQRDYAGELVTTQVCSDGRIVSESRQCDPAEAISSAALPRLAFRRSSSGRVFLAALAQPPIVPCGFDEGGIPEGRLDLASAAVDERALLASRQRVSWIVAHRRINDEVVLVPGGTWVRRTIGIAWTLTFRRLG